MIKVFCLRLLGSFIALMVLWLLLSGLYKPLIIFFGVVTVLLVLWFVRRMDSRDNDQLPLELRTISSFRYLGWLLIEIAKSNWAVTKIILSPKMPIRQNLFRIPHTQSTDLAQVIFANSITLTPGTITVETETSEFLVHALAYDDSDLEALAEMDQQVTSIEKASVDV